MFKYAALLLFALLANSIKGDVKAVDDDWWKTATFYQIYPKSFRDSNGDGIGDLKGVIEKLDYLQDLGITGVWLSPIFKSPQADNGYDISDYRDIDPQFGTLDTLLELLDEARKRNIKLILDYVPNHTSNLHDWFVKSENGEEGYEDYYIWRDGKNGSESEPPNNWISVFGYSAWTWSEKRKQFYFHQFLKEQPDLNYRNPRVRQEMKDVLSFWLDTHDIDGVRMDAVSTLLENEQLLDEPRSYLPGYSDIDYEYLDHIYTVDLPETYDVIYEWRAHLDQISESKQLAKICMAEDGKNLTRTLLYYGTADGSKLGAHFPFNFLFLDLNKTSTANDLAYVIQQWVTRLPKKYTLNWVLGNHDNHRVASKVGKDRVDALNMLTGFLPGVQITYMGEEIGMEDGEVTCEEGNDLNSNCTRYPAISRDFERTPFQWDSSEFAGFTEGNSTWLPVSSKKDECNVADQLQDDRSHLNIYKQIINVRQKLAIQKEIEVVVQGGDKDVLEIVRYNNADEEKVDVYELVLNFGEASADVNFAENNYAAFEVEVSSQNSNRKPGDLIDNVQIKLDPYEALILKPVV